MYATHFITYKGELKTINKWTKYRSTNIQYLFEINGKARNMKTDIFVI